MSALHAFADKMGVNRRHLEEQLQEAFAQIRLGWLETEDLAPAVMRDAIGLHWEKVPLLGTLGR